jgi:hypothetical protein
VSHSQILIHDHRNRIAKIKIQKVGQIGRGYSPSQSAAGIEAMSSSLDLHLESHAVIHHDLHLYPLGSLTHLHAALIG